MSKGYRYSDEFKQEAVNQVTVHGYAVVDVATRLGISDKTLYNWIKIFSKPVKKRLEDNDLQAEIARLKRELKRVEQERNILKEAAVGIMVIATSIWILLRQASRVGVTVPCD